MLTDIYMLLPQDVIDFNALNALPENNQGPIVVPTSYDNMSDNSSVKVSDLDATKLLGIIPRP